MSEFPDYRTMRIMSDMTLEHISKNIIVPTRNVIELEQQIHTWIAIGAIGGCVWGRPRIGKTHAMNYIARGLEKRFGENFPCFIWNITDHPDTEKTFYASILLAIGCPVPTLRRTALELKDMLINALCISAHDTWLRKIVLFIDEAWQLNEADFSRLMDLYNNLALKKVQFTCFLFGTRELHDLKNNLKIRGKDQIIGRFMVYEQQFFGLRSAEELSLCLSEMDSVKMLDKNGIESQTRLSQFYFPEGRGHTFYLLYNDYWKAFQCIRSKYGIIEEDVPMQYVMDSFNLCLEDYGVLSRTSVSFPGYEELVKCIEKSGYGESDDKHQPLKV